MTAVTLARQLAGKSRENFPRDSPLNQWETPIRLTALCLIAAAALAQEPKDPAYESLAKAFDSLAAHDYDTAIDYFGKAATLSPGRADIRKNLAYTLLKTGDSESAREQFGEAMQIEPSDPHLALEYAFLCFEARDNAPARKAEARRIFARVRDSGDAASKATASRAFENIDAPLAAGIERWRQVLATSPPTFSALYELAQLAEQRDVLDLAASSYKAAFQLLPERKSVLLELARVEKTRGNPEGMMSALLAASRGGETRAAELAREQLPDRYPYVYEFRKALELDPTNAALHRELAYLLLAMSEKDQASRDEAEQEFKLIVDASPSDSVAAAQLDLMDNPAKQDSTETKPAAASDPRLLGERSYAAGFLKDAKRYLMEAHEQYPEDASIALKLGWTNNMLHDDATAIQWFDIARQSTDAAISTEAANAYDNLRTSVARFRTTLWVYPLYSTRWHDLFGYGQLKTELRLKKLPIHPYVSLRLDGDLRDSMGGPSPLDLSASSFILAIGVASQTWHGATGWFEAGSGMSYQNGTHAADYRGGVSFSRTIGTSIAAEHNGWFVETLGDSVYVSRFDNDLLNYTQNKIGFTSSVGGFKVQTFWSDNLTFDVKRQYWANFVETGPGFRFHPPHTPPSLAITVAGVRGVYLRNEDNPRRPNYFDFRAGIWYAITK
jgi:Flp pilus assembly protein TadD